MHCQHDTSIKVTSSPALIVLEQSIELQYRLVQTFLLLFRRLHEQPRPLVHSACTPPTNEAANPENPHTCSKSTAKNQPGSIGPLMPIELATPAVLGPSTFLQRVENVSVSSSEASLHQPHEHEPSHVTFIHTRSASSPAGGDRDATTTSTINAIVAAL